jgi:hypothetical protein
MDDLKPWYHSKTIWGAGVTVAAAILAMAGLPLSASDQMMMTEALLQIAGAAGGLLALYGRLTATQRIY